MSTRRILNSLLVNSGRLCSRRVILPALRTATVVNETPLIHLVNRSSLIQRCYNTQSNNDVFKVVDFDDIQTIIKENGKGYHLIDVREVKELADGYIPTAHNIPLSQFDKAWLLSEKEFKDQFGFNKPEKEENIILYCLGGVRSTRAANYLSSLGYDNLKNYIGSWADYVQKLKEKSN